MWYIINYEAMEQELQHNSLLFYQILGNKTPVLGSSDVVTSTGHDAGLLSSILVAYNGHFNLRTGPEDWWLKCFLFLDFLPDFNI